MEFLCHTNATNEMILEAKNMQAKTSCNEYLIQRKFEMAHSAGFPKYGVFEIITIQGRLFHHFKSQVKNTDVNLLYILVKFCSTYFFKKMLEEVSPFSGALIPLFLEFWLHLPSVTKPVGMDSSDSPLVQHLLSSQPSA